MSPALKPLLSALLRLKCWILDAYSCNKRCRAAEDCMSPVTRLAAFCMGNGVNSIFTGCALCVMCVSVTSHGNIFWFQSHQEKDAACVQHLHCSYVRHVLPGCPFRIPNFLRWGLVLLPVQSIVLALSSVATSHVQLFTRCMHYLCMLVYM